MKLFYTISLDIQVAYRLDSSTSCRAGSFSFLPAAKSVLAINPCSKLSMPKEAASLYVTISKCPVIFKFLLCAASMAAFSVGLSTPCML